MEENNIDQVECPVCHKKLESEFALNGHIRLMKDEDHVVFRKSCNTLTENNDLPTSIATSSSGDKLIDEIITVIEKQEKRCDIDAKQDILVGKLKNMITEQQEKDIAKRAEVYQEGYDDAVEEYEEYEQSSRDQREAELVGKHKQEIAELMVHYEQKITELTAKKETEINELKTMHNQKIEDIQREARVEISRNYYYTVSKYAVNFPCPWCHTTCLIEPNSQLHFEIIKLMIQAGLGHPSCVRNYAPQIAYYWDCIYNQYQQSITGNPTNVG